MDILLAEPNTLFCDVVAPLLCRVEPAATVHVGHSYAETRALLTLHHFAVLLLDPHMPDGTPALVGQIRSGWPDTRLVLLSARADKTVVCDALQAGAAGVIPKKVSSDVLVSAVRLVLSGDRYIPATVLEAPPARDADVSAALTLRQRHVLSLASKGLANKVIARRLGISEVTVKAHLVRIYHRLGLQNRVQAAQWWNIHSGA